MRSWTVFIVSAIISGTMLAGDTRPPVKSPQRYRIAHSGGSVEYPAKGKIVIVNVQKKVSTEIIRKASSEFMDGMQLPWTVVDADTFQISDMISDKKRHGAQVAIYVVDDQALPMTLVAPEGGVGIVNVAGIGIVQDMRNNRAMLLLSRTLALVLGGSFSTSDKTLNSFVDKPEMLDNISSNELDSETMFRIVANLPQFGVSPPKRVSYKKACEEGWAPAPTNDIQKAIWEKVHAIPKKPMKIEFDPNKGR